MYIFGTQILKKLQEIKCMYDVGIFVWNCPMYYKQCTIYLLLLCWNPLNIILLHSK